MAIAAEVKKQILYHYGITRIDLPSEVQAVQLFHAGGESSPGNLPVDTHAVLLHVKDEQALRDLGWELTKTGLHIKLIFENDAPYTGQLMAIGLRPMPRTKELKKILASLPLLKFR